MWIIPPLSVRQWLRGSMTRIDNLLLRVPDSQLRDELTSAVAEVRRIRCPLQLSKCSYTRVFTATEARCRNAGIKTGMEEKREELYIEGLAIHGDPDHASSLARVAAKLWTGARAGRPSSRVISESGVRRRCLRKRTATPPVALPRAAGGPARSETLCMHGTSMRENREVSCSPIRLISGRDNLRSGKAEAASLR